MASFLISSLRRSWAGTSSRPPRSRTRCANIIWLQQQLRATDADLDRRITKILAWKEKANLLKSVPGGESLR